MIICIDYPLNIMKYNYNKSTEDWIACAEMMIHLQWWTVYGAVLVVVTNGSKSRMRNWATFVGVYLCIDADDNDEHENKAHRRRMFRNSCSLERKQ